MFTRLEELVTKEDGQDTVEYTLMIGLVVTVIWLGVSVFGIPASVETIWSNVGSEVAKAPGAGS